MTRVRMLVTTLATAVAAIGHTIMHARDARVDLSPGDRAPDFSLVGSDGRTYRLSDYAARSAVVVAWFPKAFTGG